jgi:hypothetical protein
MNKIEQYRKDALSHRVQCEARYKDEEWARVPLDYARRWAHAFEGEEVDLDAIANLVRAAEQEPGQYDISFHTRVVDMRRIYHELWEEFMTDRSGGKAE